MWSMFLQVAVNAASVHGGGAKCPIVNAVVAVSSKAEMIADGRCSVFDGDRSEGVEVGLIRWFRAGDGKLQCVNADMVDVQILKVAVDSEWIVGSFEGNFSGVDRRVVHDWPILLANCISDGGGCGGIVHGWLLSKLC